MGTGAVRRVVVSHVAVVTEATKGMPHQPGRPSRAPQPGNQWPSLPGDVRASKSRLPTGAAAMAEISPHAFTRHQSQRARNTVPVPAKKRMRNEKTPSTEVAKYATTAVTRASRTTATREART